MRLEKSHVLDPRPMLGNDRIGFVEVFSGVFAELGKFQLKKSEVLSADRAHLPLKLRPAWL